MKILKKALHYLAIKLGCSFRKQQKVGEIISNEKITNKDVYFL